MTLRITVEVLSERKVTSQVLVADASAAAGVLWDVEARVREAPGSTEERHALGVRMHARRRGALVLAARVLLRLVARLDNAQDVDALAEHVVLVRDEPVKTGRKR